jgi:hypothetical protein
MESMSKLGGIRQDVGFTEHRRINWTDFPNAPFAPNNIVLERKDPAPNWIPDTTLKIGDWRSKVRDVYLRWAITINAMHESQDLWGKKSKDRALQTTTIRPDKSGNPDKVVLAVWSSDVAAENYQKATPMLSAYGFTDLFGLLEEIIFEWHVLLLNDDPILILQGSEFRELRRYYAQRNNNEKAMERWEKNWSIRLSEWRRKRAYDGLHKVFLSYFERSKLKKPKHYKQTDVPDWAKTIECIAEIRNLLVHGESTASARLEKLCDESVGNLLNFKKDDALDIQLLHLMYFEMFFDQLLSALNLSLVDAYERYTG